MKIKLPGHLVIEEKIFDDIVDAIKEEAKELDRLSRSKDPRLPEVYWDSLSRDFKFRSEAMSALAERLENAEWEEVE